MSFKEANQMTEDMRKKLDEANKKRADKEDVKTANELSRLVEEDAPKETVAKEDPLADLKEEFGSEGDQLRSLKEELDEDPTEKEEYEAIKTIKLRKPYELKDKVLKEIVLDSTKVTGKTITEIERLYKKRVKKEKLEGNMLKELDPVFLAMTASVMSGIGYNIIMNLNVTDHSKITNTVRGFLLDF